MAVNVHPFYPSSPTPNDTTPTLQARSISSQRPRPIPNRCATSSRETPPLSNLRPLACSSRQLGGTLIRKPRFRR